MLPPQQPQTGLAPEYLVNNVPSRVRRPGSSQLTWSDQEWLEDVDTKDDRDAARNTGVFASMARDGSGRIINISGMVGISVLGRLDHPRPLTTRQ